MHYHYIPHQIYILSHIQHTSEASATGAKAEANAALIKEVVEAKASATAAEAQAKARVGLKDLGAYAG